MLTRADLLAHAPLLIAGPCAAETRERVIEIGEKVAAAGAHMYRAGLWKPRTNPESFQGVGTEGLPWLTELKEKTGLLVAVEVMEPEHIEETKGVVDVLWVGARNTQNFALLKALHDDPRPVMLKRGFILTMKEWIGAADYIGRDRVIMVERGIRTGADATRFTLDIGGALVMQKDYGMPVIIDPSHPAGRADLVPPLSLAAIAAGLDGLMVEVHTRPMESLGDTSQQLTPGEFEDLVTRVRAVHTARYGN